MSTAFLPAEAVALAAAGTVCVIESDREEILFDLYMNWKTHRAWWKRTPRYDKGVALRLLPDYLVVIVEQHQIDALEVADALRSLANAAVALVSDASMEVSAKDFAVIRGHWKSK